MKYVTFNGIHCINPIIFSHEANILERVLLGKERKNQKAANQFRVNDLFHKNYDIYLKVVFKYTEVSNLRI